MLSRIIKGKNRLSQRDPAARRQAVAELSPAKAASLQAELLVLAGGDEDPAVRKAAIAKLASADSLAGLLDDPLAAEAAAHRIAELIGSDHPLARHPLVLKVRLPALEAAEADTLLADIDDTDLLIELAISSRRAQRELILRRLSTTAALTQLEHQSRGRDKSLNRHAREQLERIRAIRHEATQTRERLVRLADALERHQRVDVDAAAEQRHSGLLREFELASARFDELAGQLRTVGEDPQSIDAARRQVADVREQIPERVPSAVVEDPFPALVTAFQALHQSMRDGAEFAAVSAEREALTNQWLSAADHMPPSSAEHQVFEAVSHAYRELADSTTRLADSDWSGYRLAPLPASLPQDPQHLRQLWQLVAQHGRALRDGERLLARIAWPEWASPSPEYARLLHALKHTEQEVARAGEHERSLKTTLEELISELTAQIEAGALKAAFGTLNRARQLSKSLPENYVADLVKTLNHEAARLTELRDWQTFATGPKREALCAAMQALVEQPFEPQDQADRIKHLRADWNELGPVSTSDDRKLADQFNALAETAFEPCRAYFAEQASLRKANLAERRRICDQLETYLNTTNWDTADKKAAERIMRAARDEWRRFHPVDRNPGRPLEERFEKLQGRLYALIKAEWDANLKLKQAIVDDARALLESDADIAQRVSDAKGLQRRWREVGITPRRPDQDLWREFRQACDGIFAARNAAQSEAEQADQNAAESARALVAEWRELVAAASAADADERVLRDYRNRFANLPRLPDNVHRELQDRFEALVRNYRELLHRQSRDAERAELQQLKAWDESVSAQEAAVRCGDVEALTLPDPLFEPRQVTLGNEVPRDALRTLAIGAELLAGVESPASERELRLQIQVDRLNAGMSQQRSAPDPLALAREWCATGPKHEQCTDLRERFFSALARAMED